MVNEFNPDGRRKVELLAPAGNPEGFYGAIHAGADAVYLAGNQYGARAYADNFSTDELLVCIRYAHLLKKKVYLTVNTLVKQRELEELPAFLEPLVLEGLDGVIVQDFGVVSCLKEHFPELALHASTQMTVTGPHGAKFLASLGFTRIVPARELSLEEMCQIKKESGLEIECFIHGAMCYCYSGQCLFSSILGDRSGNRGRCAQPCRLPYSVGKTNGYPLSMKDMCTFELLPELVAAGIDSFKIEGRMKKPEYAAGVTAIYRAYLDQILAGKPGNPSREDLNKLYSLYIRSETGNGYYHRRNGKQMITMQSPAYSSSDEALLSLIRETYLTSRKKVPVRMKGVFRLGRPAEVWIAPENDPGHWTIVRGPEAERASKAPVTAENLIKQLSKLGESSFELTQGYNNGEPVIEMDEGIFYPLKAVNELRREAVLALEEVLLHG